MTRVEQVSLYTDDGLRLAAELAPAAGPGPARAAVALCHPHPQYGGTMRSIVISVLFEALPALGCSCLRFDFRGAGESEGDHAAGTEEVRDIVAAVDALAANEPRTPIVLVGWSFGADMALSVLDPRIAGWVAIAPPLRFRDSFDAVARDTRPKHLVLAEHDEFRNPQEIRDTTATWTATTLSVVPGASHFFIGRTDRVVTDTWAGVERALN